MAVSIGAVHRKPVVVDSSSAIILFKSGLLDRLVNFYKVIISESVFFELIREGYAGACEFKRFRKENRIFVNTDVGTNNDYASHRQALINLGAGERDTILLFYGGIGELIILDDGKGASYCKNNGIPYINALLVPRILKIAGHLSEEECEYLMGRIVENGRYSPKIIEYVRSCYDEKLKTLI